MARAVNRLSARSVATAKTPGRHADGMGLYLQVDDSLAKRWVFVFQWRGARKEMGLGPIHDVSLAEAREARDRARRLVRDGINPIDARRRSRATDVRFGQLARELWESLRQGWRNEKHVADWIGSIDLHAAKLKDMDVASIGVEDVLAVLNPLWVAKASTADRLRGRIELVLDAAKAKGLRTGENPARWKGNLDHLLPRRAGLDVEHHKALAYGDLPAFMARLMAEDVLSAYLLRFIILTAVRLTMARTATWGEVRDGVWVIPKDRTKNGREHRVPLTSAAMACLCDPGNRTAPLFPLKGKPLSANAVRELLQRMGAGVTTHGFRSTFRDWAGDCTTFEREVAEAALAHQVGDEAERAYRRGDALEKRRALMEAWADFCLTPHPAADRERP